MNKPRYPLLYQVNTRVWLKQLAQGLSSPATLDDIPDAELARITGRPLAEVEGMPTAAKRERLMEWRRVQLQELVQAYYRARGWSPEA